MGISQRTSTKAEPLIISFTALALLTAAVQSTKSLCETVKRFKERNRTLGRLQDELEDLANILDSLIQVTDAKSSMLAFLHDPIRRCSQICGTFEQTMEVFNQNAVTGLRDWTKMQFMGSGVHEFIDTIGGYKSTISVGLGITTMHTSEVSHRDLQEYDEMAKDTAYDLGVHLQRIDEKMALSTFDNACNSDIRVDLEDERKATTQCLRICEDAKSRVKSLTNRGSSQVSQNTAEEVCRMASEVPNRNIYRIGEASASGGSDQVVVATTAGSFSIEKAESRSKSTQLVGSITDETLKRRVRDHYV